MANETAGPLRVFWFLFSVSVAITSGLKLPLNSSEDVVKLALNTSQEVVTTIMPETTPVVRITSHDLENAQKRVQETTIQTTVPKIFNETTRIPDTVESSTKAVETTTDFPLGVSDILISRTAESTENIQLSDPQLVTQEPVVTEPLFLTSTSATRRVSHIDSVEPRSDTSSVSKEVGSSQSEGTELEDSLVSVALPKDHKVLQSAVEAPSKMDDETMEHIDSKNADQTSSVAEEREVLKGTESLKNAFVTERIEVTPNPRDVLGGIQDTVPTTTLTPPIDHDDKVFAYGAKKTLLDGRIRDNLDLNNFVDPQTSQIEFEPNGKDELFSYQDEIDYSGQAVAEISPAPAASKCPAGEFLCVSEQKCIHGYYVCDSLRRWDCQDGSDEDPSLCQGPGDNSCPNGNIRCAGSKKCIPEKWRCDGEPDCDEADDEDPARCHALECRADQFTCRSHSNTSRHCVPLNWVCDSERDCADGSDERSCNATCTSEQFTCSTGKCISRHWRCDGDVDCRDGDNSDDSDERDCPPTECTSSQMACGDGSCVQQSWVCDGEADCGNGADERNCSAPRSITPRCGPHEVACPKEGGCLKQSYLCDGDHDCASGWDERPDACRSVKCSDGMFLCHEDETCILSSLRCNGYPECVHGEDELGCSTACNVTSEFDCGGGTACVSRSQVCDGREDCPSPQLYEGGLLLVPNVFPGGSGRPPTADEANCGVDECSENNGGCSHICVDDPSGFHCECQPGYYLLDGSVCRDIDECQGAGVCSQRCVNLQGGHKCECVAGYSRDPHDHARCKANEGHPSLLFAHSKDIRKISLDHEEVTAIVNDTRGTIALDFVFKTGMIFWTDLRDKCIYKAPIDEGAKKVAVVLNDVTNSDGLAVDWLYNHLYWTNSDRNSIELADFNGNMHKTLLNDSIDEPRAIALYPLEGWLFWTDWGKRPKIERAGMDGSNRQAIVTDNIVWPNALTLDYVLRKIYWADSKGHGLFCADFDGSHRRTVLHSSELLPHPFSITVFEDHLYWSDWTKDAILSANKFTGANISVIAHVQVPMTVHVYHSYRQPNGTNHCVPLNGLCSHLCLPAPQVNAGSRKVTCACPDGMIIMADNLTCQKIGYSPSPTLIPPPGVYGSSDQRQQANGDRSYLAGGSLVVMVVVATCCLVAVTAVTSYLIYRYITKRSLHTINFDNPAFKKQNGLVPNSASQAPLVHQSYSPTTPSPPSTFHLNSTKGFSHSNLSTSNTPNASNTSFTTSASSNSDTLNGGTSSFAPLSSGHNRAPRGEGVEDETREPLNPEENGKANFY